MKATRGAQFQVRDRVHRIGAGAHAKLSFPDRIVRQTRVRNPAAYLDRAARALRPFEEQVLEVNALPFEFMLNAMRLVAGVPAQRFQERTGISLMAIEPRLAEAESKGLMGRDAFRLWPTPMGLRFLNNLQSLFLPSHAPTR